jgi:hypothetical protein
MLARRTHAGMEGKVRSGKKSCTSTWVTNFSDWNIPKHLAKFKFNNLSDGGLSISVYPREDGLAESKTPFFSAIFKPLSYLPSIPMSTTVAKYIGLDLNIVQPPLPAMESAQGELPGTDAWCKIMPFESSRKASVGWWDLKQQTPGVTENDPLLANESPPNEGDNKHYENWWPGGSRRVIGMVMEDAEILFPEGDYWTG